ncbi:MAG: ABC transporter ATP-binding protein [Lachnospiraceae bacterium]|nr:ABC transporter ATP-binding protein [Lachnospiraceae bacterium]
MLDVKGLCKGYRKKGEYVVRNIDIHVEKGTIHGLIGHNGSGKTTIIKCLTGIYQPDEGQVLINGEPVYDNPASKARIGYVADSNQMFGGYRVLELVKLYQGLYEDFSVSDFDSLNQIFQVNTKKRINHLSKGQQMRVSFMLNMARNPEVLILDEPTSGLDAMAKRDLLDTLVTAVENNELTVLISSHHLEELEKICDSVSMLKDGEIYLQDGLDEVTGQIVKYQVVFPEGAPKELYHRKDVCHMSNVGSVYTVVLAKETEHFAEEMKSAGAVLVEQMPVGLEESFIYMNKNMGGKADE